MAGKQYSKKPLSRTDYEKEKIAALLAEYFSKREELAALQAEIETKYPEVAEKLRNEFSDMQALHDDAHRTYQNIKENES